MWHSMAHLGTTLDGTIYMRRARIGGDTIGMKPNTRKTEPNAVIRAAADGSLSRKLKKYLRSCRPPDDADPKKDLGRMPNLAGFCGFLRCGSSAMAELKRDYPAQYDYVCAVLEDEALNSPRSPAVINTYLKEKFGYGEKGTSADTGNLRLVFEHDITEDGA